MAARAQHLLVEGVLLAAPCGLCHPRDVAASHRLRMSSPIASLHAAKQPQPMSRFVGSRCTPGRPRDRNDAFERDRSARAGF